MKTSVTTTAIHTKPKGLTMVELMIATALGIFLTLGITTLYIDTKSNDNAGVALANIQESARIAMDIIAKDVRMAGYQGCADNNNVTLNIIADNPPTTDFSATALRGFEVTGANWAAGTEFDGENIETMARTGSDVIAIQRAVSGTTDVQDNAASNANIQVTNNDFGFEQGDAVLVSNCENADLFRISSNPDSLTWAHANNVNTNNRLGTIYSTGGEVFQFSSTVYFVADTGRVDPQGNAVYSLYRQTHNMGNAAANSFNIEELVEGVESLQILYGERLANDNIRYVPADTAGIDMNNVVNVRIGLLIASNETVRNQTDTQTYSLPGELITPDTEDNDVTHPTDRRLRKTFTQSVSIRNRG